MDNIRDIDEFLCRCKYEYLNDSFCLSMSLFVLQFTKRQSFRHAQHHLCNNIWHQMNK